MSLPLITIISGTAPNLIGRILVPKPFVTSILLCVSSIKPRTSLFPYLEGKFKDLTKAQQQEFIDLASKRFKVSKNGIRNGMSILNKYFDTVMPKVK